MDRENREIPSLPPLIGLEAFQHAAKTLSFKNTAAHLNLTASAVSHRIRNLEQYLGTPLFHRQTRALSLTADGEAYHAAVSKLFSQLSTATNRIRQRTHAAPLRLSVLPLFASAFLIPRLPDFRARHPDIAVTIDTKSSIADLTAGEADIGIRNMTVAPSGKGVMKLLDTRAVILCTPEIAKRVRCVDDLAHETLIHCAPRPRAWMDYLSREGRPLLKPKADLWMDTIPGGLEAAQSGQGLVLTISPLAEMTAAGAKLVEPFKLIDRAATSYYLAHRPEDQTDRRIQAFRQWLGTEMARFKKDRAQK